MAGPEPRDAAYVEDLAPNLLTISEDAMARRWPRQYCDRFRFCHTRKKWLMFNGAYWEIDDALYATESIRDLCREQSVRVRQPSGLLKAKYISAVEQLAKSDASIRTTAKDWDRDPWLLGTPSGVVDLRTGELRAGEPDDMISRATEVAPAISADCPRFIEHMLQMTCGDEGSVAFLQRYCGYCLCASTREQKAVFLHGPPNSGKGKFLNHVQDVFGGYADSAPMNVFIRTTTERHPADMATVLGSYRLMTISETNPDQTWDQQRFKGYLGEDKINSRTMGRDFAGGKRAEAKLLMVGNHMPRFSVVGDPDPAMERRLLIVPCKYRPKTINNRLDEVFQAEHPGILRWLIQGCMDWQSDGLRPPRSVQEYSHECFHQWR